MTEKKKPLSKRLAEKYREMSARAPEAKLALDLHPVTGIPMSAMDAAASAAEGMYGDAALEALGVVPGVKYIPGMGLTKAMTKYASKKAEAARTVDRASDAVSYAGEKKAEAKDRMGLKKGGAVKPRGVGKALRGWGRAGKTK
jgi:hypothetical protein